MTITNSDRKLIWPLSELVTVRPRFLRSVNLERDFAVPGAGDGYVPTPSAQAATERIMAGVDAPAHRAWSITGPYGTGKSAFALRLTQILYAQGFRPVLVTGGREPLAQSLLRGLERQQAPPAPQVWGENVLQQGTRSTVSTRQNAKQETLDIVSSPQNWGAGGATPSARDIAHLYEQAAQERAAQDGKGVLLIIDELGKALEYAALHPAEGDVQVLQELAEAAVRSGDAPLIVVTVLHQAFDEYAHRLPGAQQAEWRKVQGRFQDLAWGDAAEDAARLVAGAVDRAPHPPSDALLEGTFARWAGDCRALHLLPRTMSGGEWDDVCRRAYPLHPVSLLALPHIFRRFGQNERSLFGFLASAAPHGFADFLTAHALIESAPPPALRVADVYDYITNTLGAGLLSQPGGAWAGAADALLRAEGRPPAWAALIKTVGLLHALGDSARLPASRELLRFACDDFAPADVDAALDGLRQSTLLTYRTYKRAFRPYAGSDVDVDALVRDARAGASADPVQVAARLSLSTLPIVARRHSYQTGTLRAFDVRPCRPADLSNADLFAVPPGMDGLVLLCLVGEEYTPPRLRHPSPSGHGEGPVTAGSAASHGAQITATGRDRTQDFQVISPSLLPSGEGYAKRGVGFLLPPHLLLRVVPETDTLRGAAADVDALLRVSDDTPELVGDSVARREVDERLREASAVFGAEWDALLREGEEAPLTPQFWGEDVLQQGARSTVPTGHDAEHGTLHSVSSPQTWGVRGAFPFSFWLWQGQQQPPGATLQTLLSAACDAAYEHAPTLRNELINRRQLTSVAAAARRTLIAAMLTRAPDERLGMDADLWPPERSMYVSTLLESGLHRQTAPATEDNDAVWSFCAPEPGTPFAAVWQAIEGFLFGGALEAKPLTDLHQLLTLPPFGMTEGVIPVLLCAVLLVQADEVLVYEESRFVTQLDAATFERMMKRPEDYALQGCKVSGERQVVVERFARGLLTKGQEPTLVNVVRVMFREFARLPEYTLKTRHLPADVRTVRDVFKQARAPERLLFVDLPTLLSCQPFGADDTDAENVDTFFAKWNEVFAAITGAYDGLLSRMEDMLRSAFDVADWEELRARSADIEAHLSEARLVSFVQRASDMELGRQKWLGSVGSVVVGRPPSAWSDAEAKRFAPLLQPLAAAFKHSELLAFDMGQRAGNEERVGLRLSVTRDTGEEDASLVILSREENVALDSKADEIYGHFNVTMKGKTREERLTVIAQVTQKVMREDAAP